MTIAITSEVPTRQYAHVLDVQIPGPDEVRGCDASRDAIGGYYGIQWYSYFCDRTTGEIYKVCQSDGVNGGKSAYRDIDEQWRQDVYYNVLRPRFKKMAEMGEAQITISRSERIVMQGFVHATMLETAAGACDGKQSDTGLEGGLVGHYHGIPVICDINQDDTLPPPQ